LQLVPLSTRRWVQSPYQAGHAHQSRRLVLPSVLAVCGPLTGKDRSLILSHARPALPGRTPLIRSTDAAVSLGQITSPDGARHHRTARHGQAGRRKTMARIEHLSGTAQLVGMAAGDPLHRRRRGETLQCLWPDVAVVDVDASVTGHRAPALGATSPDGVLRTAMLQVLAEEGGAWHVVAFHNTIVQVHA
jgi:hypothetical protein